MSVLYVIVGAIALAVAIFVCVGVGQLTKYLLRKHDSVHDHDEVPSFLVGFLVIVVLAIVIGLVVTISHAIGESIINALNK